MLLVNNKGRVVDVSQDNAKGLLAETDKFEVYNGQAVNRWGIKIFGMENYKGDIVEENVRDNDEFNPASIEWLDTKNQKGYPVKGSHSESEQEESTKKDNEIFELKKMLKSTLEAVKPQMEVIEEETATRGKCKKCGKMFDRKDGRYKFCNDCK